MATEPTLPALKISKRVKHRCVFRLTKGPRRGRMCGASVSGMHASDYCAEHALKILNDQAIANLKAMGERE